MMAVTVVLALVTCWKMTLVAAGAEPALYDITRSLKTISRWESRINDADEKISDVLVESFLRRANGSIVHS